MSLLNCLLNSIWCWQTSADGGELFEEVLDVEVFPENIAANIIKQILKAVSYMHKNGIAHRDLKPENLLITKQTKNGYVIKGF